MTLPSFRKLLSRLLPASRSRSPRGRYALPLRLETLEDRNLLATFLVNTTNDSGPGSLRQAILDSNAPGDPSNVIQFAIAGAGVHTINLLSPLPTVSRSVLIDGYSQPGSSPNTRDVGDDAVLTIELNGAGAGVRAIGLTISAANSTVRGLVINRFGQAGVVVTGAGATNDVVAGNFIGTNVTGTAALPNGQGGGTGGVLLVGGAHGNVVGGELAAGRNLISGNNGEGVMLLKQDGADTHDNSVLNNYIGTNAAGAAALGNLSSGIFVPFSGGNKIDGNLVSGNTGFAGISLGGIQPGGGVFRLGSFASSVGDGANNEVAGNFIGTDATGTVALPNAGFGISVDGGNQMLIGGTVRAAANLISGNGRDGIRFFDNAQNMRVLGNRIGTGGGGLAAVGNAGDGIAITGGANGVVVGGGVAGGRNLISGNAGNGVSITTGATGNVIAGNDVGVDVTGARALGNQMNGVSVSASRNTIGGTTALARNVISGNLLDGVAVLTGSSTLIQGNFIGTDYTGTAALGNHVNGVEGAPGTISITVGGSAAGAGNVISGNLQNGVLFRGVFPPTGVSTTNLVAGNRIGTDVSGTAALPNSTGVSITNSSGDKVGGTTAAARNLISGNTFDGIVVTGPTNAIQGNYIGTDAAGAAALGNGRAGVDVIGTHDILIGTPEAGAGNLISGNGQQGIFLQQATATMVQGNLIGTDATGTAALGNHYIGVDLEQSSGNTLGGTTAGARNVIAASGIYGVNLGLSYSNVVQGNYVGTNAAGTAALGNGASGIAVSAAEVTTGNTIGGTAAGAGNLISGNAADGIHIAASGNVVQGNFIGTNAAGTAALGNHGNGVSIFGLGRSGGTTIGGTDAGAGNVISGNLGDGVMLMYANHDFVEGNRIGTDATGTAALGNGAYGVELRSSNNNALGVAGGGNVISANHLDGVFISLQVLDSSETSSGNVLQGNRIGTDATGTAALGNRGDGVHGRLVTSNTIGGTMPETRNIISGNRFSGILFDTSNGNVEEGNYIGTDATGNHALGNLIGVEITAGSNTIGGTAPGAGNLISGNQTEGIELQGNQAVVQGNNIGTDVTGTVALPNQTGVLIVASTNVLGGTVSGARNVISGNLRDGVEIFGSFSQNNVVQGNYIGTDAAGTHALPNLMGVDVYAGSGNLIGGTAAGAGNLISGNTQDGVIIQATFADGNQVQGNFIGTDVTGTHALGNVIGVQIDAQATASTIGGTAAGAGNVISGNTAEGILLQGNGAVVQGNKIGSDVTGTVALANPTGILITGSNNVIGGTASGAGNLISGNTQYGVLIQGANASGNQLQGNYIGTDVTGTHALGNNRGVHIDFGTNNVIGGSAAGAGNLISGNSAFGVELASDTGTVVQGNTIGADVTGTRPLGNSSGIITSGSGGLIGGTTPGARNLISGNHDFGIQIVGNAANNQVQGNYVGTDVTGTHILGNGNSGVAITGHNNTVGGTAAGAGNLLSGNGSYGVQIGQTVLASNNLVQGNLIGTDVTGTAALNNHNGGVLIDSGMNNLIGGTDPVTRNVISGNAGPGVSLVSNGSQVQGNTIGTNATGTAALPNLDGVLISANFNTVGGTAAGAGNVISGNQFSGIAISGNGNTVQGNFIGTNAAGTAALGNMFGVDVTGSNNLIGGTVAGAGNLISGNVSYGVYLTGTGTNNQVQGNLIGTNAAGGSGLANSYDIRIDSSNNTVGGTTAGARNVISGSFNGVYVAAGTGNVIQGNYIGTDATGTHAVGNNFGVDLAGTSAQTTVGGTAAGAGNLISGNSSDGVQIFSNSNVVQGNLIGTDLTGTQTLANGGDGVIVTNGNTNLIGGAAPGAGNVISGNHGDGVGLAAVTGQGTGNVIQDNLIGTDVSGTHALANARGIYLNNMTATDVIGNLISGNTGDGIFFFAGGANDRVRGNYIGTDFTGSVALGNLNGVELASGASGVVIGGADVGAGNVISGNRVYGVTISASGNTVQGNLLGTDVTGTTALGNSTAVTISGSNNLIGGPSAGARNVISGNLGDGVTISGGSGNTVQGNYIGTDISGTMAVSNIRGLFIRAASNRFLGNLISGNRNNGLELDLPGADNNVVQGNYIGTDATGTVALANNGVGVAIQTSGNLIGGTTAGQGNLISGNVVGIETFLGSGNTIQGNRIGTDVTGTSAVPNQTGIDIGAGSNTIGGTAAGAGNLISGNSASGISLFSGGNLVQGNLIGLDATGTLALANSNGVIVSAVNNTIGGAAPGARNVISGNHNAGILLIGGGVIQGNYIGTDITGSAAVGNAIGVSVSATNVTIGGTAAGAGNVISGNTLEGILLAGSNNQVQGNLIGTDATGTAAVPNRVGVLVTGATNFVGGVTPGAGNVISGNTTDGVNVQGSGAFGNRILGNRIGTDATGTVAVPNSNGVTIAAPNTLVGGFGGGNLISGNFGAGVFVQSDHAAIGFNRIGTDVTGTRALHNNSGIDVEGAAATDTTVGGGNGEGNLISGGNGTGVLFLNGATRASLGGNRIGTDVTGTQALGNGIGVLIQNASNVLIGGLPGPTRNVISGNGNDVVLTNGATGNVLRNNLIGTDVTGTVALPGNLGVFLDGGATGNTIGGTTAAARNVISGHAGYGVSITSAGNVVEGNYIGTDITGTAALPNQSGVYVGGANNSIGGTATGAGNLLSGNMFDGVLILGANNFVQGNFIGTDAGGTQPLGNGGNGVDVYGAGASGNQIGGTAPGAGNVIAYNGNDGVLINASTGVTILRNRIFANANLGIELANHGNNDQPAPVLSSAVSGGGFTTIQGSFTGQPSTTYLVEFYADSDSQGRQFLGAITVTTGADGVANLSFTLGLEVAPGQFLTATATDPNGDTSAFSTPVMVTGG